MNSRSLLDESQRFLEMPAPCLTKARSSTLSTWNLPRTVSSPKLRLVPQAKEFDRLYTYTKFEQDQIELSERIVFGILALSSVGGIISAFAR